MIGAPSRGHFLRGLGSILAPAIVTAASLMPLRGASMGGVTYFHTVWYEFSDGVIWRYDGAPHCDGPATPR
jgi:hypothetical protein